MLKPIRPPNRIIAECDGNNLCDICGSSLAKNFFGRSAGCIQPECINYHKDCSELDSKLRKIIFQGNNLNYQKLIQTIVKIHREVFREENIPASKEFLQDVR